MTNIKKNVIAFMALMSILPTSAATISGQGFMRNGNSTYTCMGSVVRVEKITKDSILDKVHDLTFDIFFVSFLKKIAITEEEKKDALQEEKKLQTKENEEILKILQERTKQGFIKTAKCDSGGNFIVENLPVGSYGVSTVVKPTALIMNTPIYGTIEIKENHVNQIVLYTEQ